MCVNILSHFNTSLTAWRNSSQQTRLSGYFAGEAYETMDAAYFNNLLIVSPDRGSVKKKHQ